MIGEMGCCENSRQRKEVDLRSFHTLVLSLEILDGDPGDLGEVGCPIPLSCFLEGVTRLESLLCFSC